MLNDVAEIIEKKYHTHFRPFLRRARALHKGGCEKKVSYFCKIPEHPAVLLLLHRPLSPAPTGYRGDRRRIRYQLTVYAENAYREPHVR